MSEIRIDLVDNMGYGGIFNEDVYVDTKRELIRTGQHATINVRFKFYETGQAGGLGLFGTGKDGGASSDTYLNAHLFYIAGERYMRISHGFYQHYKQLETRIEEGKIYCLKVGISTNVEVMSYLLTNEYGIELESGTDDSQVALNLTNEILVGCTADQNNDPVSEFNGLITHFAHYDGDATKETLLIFVDAGETVIDYFAEQDGVVYNYYAGFWIDSLDVSDYCVKAPTIKVASDTWNAQKGYSTQMTMLNTNALFVYKVGDLIIVNVDGTGVEQFKISEVVANDSEKTVRLTLVDMLADAGNYKYETYFAQPLKVGWRYSWWAQFDETEFADYTKQTVKLNHFFYKMHAVTLFDWKFSFKSEVDTSPIFKSYTAIRTNDVNFEDLCFNLNHIPAFSKTQSDSSTAEEEDDISYQQLVLLIMMTTGTVLIGEEYEYYTLRERDYTELSYSDDDIKNRLIFNKYAGTSLSVSSNIDYDGTAPHPPKLSFIDLPSLETISGDLNYIRADQKVRNYALMNSFWIFYVDTSDDIQHFYYDDERQNFITQFCEKLSLIINNEVKFQKLKHVGVYARNSKMIDYSCELSKKNILISNITTVSSGGSTDG